MGCSNVHTQILLDYGADVNAFDGDEWTALHIAARYGHSETVQVSLEVHEQFQ